MHDSTHTRLGQGAFAGDGACGRRGAWRGSDESDDLDQGALREGADQIQRGIDDVMRALDLSTLGTYEVPPKPATSES